MNDAEALDFVRSYFDELFGKRNVDALDAFLDEEYFDDDIGDPAVDHRQNSKDYLRALFRDQPAIGVTVHSALTRDGVIAAFLEWTVMENGEKKTLRKGVAMFVLRGRKIVKRHTFIYEAA